ncbi:low affinity iron permease family protein [Sphingomonas glacialis]|uniref:Low affinity iron permease family protein n=1 Tax=Sphingomonas glacialis TaxID=658225 RepID=A0A502FUL5_9SPHN|nr:low affinity iron permease family protein [Sphingomonas glacialis]TPG53080.1 low affinity iron permease family protein [Sphingomonas glacialis]
MEKLFETIAQKATGWAGRPPAFVIALSVIVIWGVTGPLFHYSDTWQLVINTGTTVVTFLMVFLIQNAQNRDASAIQAKLDEIIRATTDARNAFIGIEHLTQTELEGIRAMIEHDCGEGSTDHHAIERLIGRL